VRNLKFKIGRLTIKITLFIISLIFLSLFVFSFVFLLSEQNKMSEEILEDGLIFAEFITRSIYDDYVREYTHIHSQEGFDGFKEGVEQKLDKNKDVTKVSLVGINGKVIFDSDEFKEGKKYNGSGRFIEDSVTLGLLKNEDVSYLKRQLNGEDIIEIVMPIEETSGGHLMSMRYIVSYNSLIERMAEVYQQILLIIVPIFIITFVLTITFSISLTKPIIMLRGLTEKVRKGNLSVKINLKTRDEIGELASSFNQMTKDLKESRKGLEEYSKDLEKEVKERTVELEKSKKELEARNEELERFNKMAVGRELKMVELKKRIKELENELKKKQK